MATDPTRWRTTRKPLAYNRCSIVFGISLGCLCVTAWPTLQSKIRTSEHCQRTSVDVLSYTEREKKNPVRFGLSAHAVIIIIIIAILAYKINSVAQCEQVGGGFIISGRCSGYGIKYTPRDNDIVLLPVVVVVVESHELHLISIILTRARSGIRTILNFGSTTTACLARYSTIIERLRDGITTPRRREKGVRENPPISECPPEDSYRFRRYVVVETENTHLRRFTRRSKYVILCDC